MAVGNSYTRIATISVESHVFRVPSFGSVVNSETMLVSFEMGGAQVEFSGSYHDVAVRIVLFTLQREKKTFSCQDRNSKKVFSSKYQSAIGTKYLTVCGSQAQPVSVWNIE